MDASKLRNILADLTIDSNKNIIDTLDTLVSNISSNQQSEIVANFDKIKSHFTESVVNKYSPSNLQIVESIGATEYFGLSALKKINTILTENSYNIQKTNSDLQEYLKARNDFLDLVKTTNDNLGKLNINPHYYIDDTFEVGILMPTNLTGNKITSVTKELNRWDKVFKTLKELTGETPGDTEINFVNNGSLQFFIDNTAQIGACLAVAVERVVKLYKNIVEIRIAKEKLKELGVSSGEQKTIEKQEKEIFNKEIDKIALDLVKEFASKSNDSGRINELKIAMKGHVAYIAKCIDNGITIEIIPPEIKKPDELEETANAEEKNENKKLKATYEKALKQIEIVQKSMDTIKTVGKTGVDIVKLLIDPDTDNSDEEKG